MPKPKKYSQLLLVIAISCLITIGLFYYRSTHPKYSMIEPLTKPSPSPIINKPNWQTDTNFKYGFTFKYPTTLTQKVFSPESQILFGTDNVHEFRINSFIKPITQSIDDFVYHDGIGNNYGQAFQDQSGGNSKITFKSSTKVGNLKIWEPSNTFPSANGTFIRFIEYQDKLVWFSLDPYEDLNYRNNSQIPNQDEYLQYFDLILSSFKFFSPNPAKDITQTYSNPNLGISFNYSDQLTLDPNNSPKYYLNSSEWLINLLTPTQEILEIQSGGPADWGDCKDRLESNNFELNGLKIFYFKETNSKADYCKGGPDAYIGWYGYITKDQRHWFISLSTNNLSSQNQKYLQPLFMQVLKSFKSL